jgi:uncharacterized protein (DUF2147 family)
MKKIAFILLQIFMLPLLGWSTWHMVNSTESADLIIGNWKPSNGRSVISMYKGVAANGEDPTKYYGKIVWLLEPNDDKGQPRTDINNPDVSKRSLPLKGLVIVKNMTFDEVDGNLVQWEGGTIYDPNNGSEYSFAAEIDNKNKSVLNGRGYIGVSLFGRTDTWTKLVKK